MEEHIKRLLNKYIESCLNSEERNSLKQQIASLSDNELTGVLSEIWEEYSLNPNCPVNFDELTKKIQTGTVQGSTRRLPLIIQIAASILLVISLSLSIYLYHDNKNLSNFLHKDITVHVNSGDKSNLLLPDGTEVFLNSETNLTYPSNFGYKQREVTIEGEAYMKIAKDKQVPFFIHTKSIVIEVLGTEFNLTSYDNMIETTLIEGSVKLTTKGKSPQTTHLAPNQKAVYDIENNELTITETSTYFETAWMRGELIFRSTNFADMMKKLQMRYGVTISIENNRYDPDLFSGSFKESSVYGILKNLQLHYNFTYTIKDDDKIHIRFKEYK